MNKKAVAIGTGITFIVTGGILLAKTRGKCEEGKFRCEGKDLQQCINGEWMLLEADSPKCGVSECVEGSSVCRGADRYRCVEGHWALELENATECIIPTAASLHGRVSDKSNGLSIKEVTVIADGVSDTSDNNGSYQIEGLELGTCIVTCSMDGYKDYERSIILNKDTELNIQLTPVSAYPEVSQATCPYYDATTFPAPNALEKLFEHVLEANHIDIASPWCLFCGDEFKPKDTEWKTVRKVFDHWVAEHLDKLTAEPGGGNIYIEGLPAQAMFGEQITVKHGFELEEAPGEYHIRLRFECEYGGDFDGAGHDFLVDQTGEYSYTETITIPTREYGNWYTVSSRCIYKYSGLESVLWDVKVKDIYIGEEVPPPIVPEPPAAIPCSYCEYKPSSRYDLISHMESNHPNLPYLISGSIEPNLICGKGWIKFPIEAYLPPLETGEQYMLTVWQATDYHHTYITDKSGFVDIGARFYHTGPSTSTSDEPVEITTRLIKNLIWPGQGAELYWNNAPTGIYMLVPKKYDDIWAFYCEG